MVIAARDTKIKPGYKLTEVGVIPEEWEIVLLDSVAKRGSGHTPDKKHPEYWDGDIKWISLRDSDRLDALYISDTAAKITALGIAYSSAVMHPVGTVVLSRDAGVGKSAITTEAMAVSQHFMAWQCNPHLSNHFLYYWLQAEKPEFERIAMGNTIKTIGLPYFKDLKIPLPSLPEQQAIATALSDVDALITSLDKLIAKKRNIKQATMQQLLTGKTRLPGFSGNWKVKKLGEIAHINMGQSPDSKNYNNKGIGMPLIQGNADIENMESISRVWTTQITKTCNKDDLIMTVRAPVGSIGIATNESCLGRGVCALKPISDNSHFLFHLMVFLEDKWKILEQGSTFASANSSQIAGFPLSITTSIDEQKAIATILSDMDAEIVALEQKRDKTRVLKQGMMQELLTGKTRLI